MKENCQSFMRQVLKDQRGQALYVIAFAMVVILGMTGFVVDIGNAFFSYRQLQAATDAAALAGAQGLPTSGAIALNNATAYSALSGKQNAHPNLQNVQMASGYPLLKCLTTLTNQGIGCVPTGIGAGTANAIQVRQQASVSTYFIRVLGIKSIPMTVTATASMRGAAVSPYNVAIILDTTASMQTQDTNCGGQSRLSCAMAGVQVLLNALSPCPSSQASCTITKGVATNSVDRVSLFTFPNITTTSTSDDYDCSGTNPTTQVYTFPAIGASTMSTMPYTTTTGSGTKTKTTTVQMTYQVTYGLGDADGNGFLSDYRTSDTSSLNTSSDLALAVGGKSGCPGMGDPGGQGTYYAGAIYAAQAALTAEAAANPNSQNVLILVSDGDATAKQSEMATGTQSTTLATSNPSNSYLYPSWNHECQQAVLAAQYATSQGTTVYSVAYGAESTGCTTDKAPYNSPCYTMQNIASAPTDFYSDYKQSGSGSICIAGTPVADLNGIFTAIVGGLTVARLIPDNTP